MLDLTELFAEAKKELWSRDYDGYCHEMSTIEVLKKHGLYKYVKYRNPKNPRLWKKKKGVGVDKVLKVGYYTFYTEESYCSKDYHYRRKWFEKCRLPRFAKYPNDKLHKYIILTNRPHNFNSVKDLAKQHNIQIMNLNSLITLIRQSVRPPDFVFSSLLNYIGLDNSSVDLDDLKGHTTQSNTTNTTKYVYAYDETNKEYALNLVRRALKLCELKRKYPFYVHIPSSWLD